LPADLDGIIGLTAGASAPEELVDAVLARLAPVDGVEVVRITDEDEYFPPPAELRNLLRSLTAAIGIGLMTPIEPGPLLSDDRAIAASDVLASLQS
jgi:4-hydroxy-3-methylbut-2-enyl diphosphate reductase